PDRRLARPCGPPAAHGRPDRRRSRRTAATPHGSSAAAPPCLRSPPDVPWCSTRSRSVPVRTEPGPALLSPPILRRDPVTVEGTAGVVVVADRGLRPAQHADQVGGPLIQVRRRPMPRILVAERKKLPDDGLSTLDSLLGQTASAQLLLGPTLQHRLHHRVF